MWSNWKVSDLLATIPLSIKPSNAARLICSGKSTLFLTLLRLLNAKAGSIEVDGVDICHLPVHVVRRRCFIAVPQDPFILPGASVRFNIDPYDEHEDEIILKVLGKTGLWSDPSTSQLQNTSPGNPENLLLYGTPHSGFLSQPLSTFLPGSTGQILMFSFAQALLRAQPPTRNHGPAIHERKPIVILDGAGSSLDLETEAKIQEMTKEYFTDQGHTVISIAHRVNNVQENPRPERESILWMRDGQLDEPQTYSKGIMHTGGGIGDISSLISRFSKTI
jgi:ABC-type multidrug transport system fused ATPase/permease subunit